MSGINDFLDLMPHTVQYAAFASRDSYGKPSYGVDVAYRSRVIYKQRLVRDKNGSETVARGFVWLVATSFIASPEDRLTLPDGEKPVVLFSETIPDESGTHHVKVWFQ